jgi:hypothetical protein
MGNPPEIIVWDGKSVIQEGVQRVSMSSGLEESGVNLNVLIQ